MSGQAPASFLLILAALLVLAGAAFTLSAAIGLTRFPDLYSRMHAASKAGTVGSGLLLFAAGLASGDGGVLLRAVCGFVFFVLTAPVAAHLIARAAHRRGHRPESLAGRDDYARDLAAEEQRRTTA